MVEYQKINNISIPIKYELRNVSKRKIQRYGQDTFAYRFVIFVNGRKTRREGLIAADSIKDLKKKVIEEYFY